MKTRKEETSTEDSVLRIKAKGKRRLSTPKAGASLEKAVENVQQIFKKKKAEAQTSSAGPAIKNDNEKLKSGTFKPSIKKRLKNRGIVYIGHLPHGFYEEQMKDYFKQFGKVSRVRVARSKNTGRSRGYGYIEFFNMDVAKVAAETMNNYLMCGRLLKTTYIPPEKQHSGFFMGVDWTEEKYPKLKKRKKVTRSRNKRQSAKKYENYVKKSLSKLSTLEHKLRDRGISLKFQPVDVPEKTE